MELMIAHQPTRPAMVKQPTIAGQALWNHVTAAHTRAEHALDMAKDTRECRLCACAEYSRSMCIRMPAQPYRFLCMQTQVLECLLKLVLVNTSACAV